MTHTPPMSLLPQATLVIEGQEYEVPTALLQSGKTVEEQDRNLRDALRPNFDLVATATFRREVKDGRLLVTVIKGGPGTKGADKLPVAYWRIVQCLQKAPETLNPVMNLACEIHLLEAAGKLNRRRLLVLRPRIESALLDGRDENEAIARARLVLSQARAVPSRRIPSGF